MLRGETADTQGPLLHGVPGIVFFSGMLPISAFAVSIAILNGECHSRAACVYLLNNHGHIFEVSRATWWTQCIIEYLAAGGGGVVLCSGAVLMILNTARPGWYVNGPRYRRTCNILGFMVIAPFFGILLVAVLSVLL